MHFRQIGAGMLITVALLAAGAACETIPQAYPPQHIARLAGSGISLDDYVVTDTYDTGSGPVTNYTRLASAGSGTSGQAFLAAIPEIWDTMPSLPDLVAAYGDPPVITLADDDAGVRVILRYETGDLYYGHNETVWEIRFGPDHLEFTHDGVGVGSAIADVTAAFGAPVETVNGEIEWADQVLYVTPDGRGYISYGNHGVRFFLTGESEAELVVLAMYLFEPGR